MSAGRHVDGGTHCGWSCTGCPRLSRHSRRTRAPRRCGCQCSRRRRCTECASWWPPWLRAIGTPEQTEGIIQNQSQETTSANRFKVRVRFVRPCASARPRVPWRVVTGRFRPRFTRIRPTIPCSLYTAPCAPPRRRVLRPFRPRLRTLRRFAVLLSTYRVASLRVRVDMAYCLQPPLLLLVLQTMSLLPPSSTSSSASPSSCSRRHLRCPFVARTHRARASAACCFGGSPLGKRACEMRRRAGASARTRTMTSSARGQ